MRVLPMAMVILLGFLVLHASAYGVGFLADSDGGLSEFGYETADTVGDDADAAARILIRLVGIAMLGMAAFTVLAAWNIIRSDRAGLGVASVLGVGRLLVGVAVAFDERLWFDAVFFSATGLLVIIGAGVLWASGWGRPPATPA